MKVDRKQFLSVLAKCLPGIANGNVLLDGADSFIFSGDHVYTYNDHIGVAVPFKPESGEGLDVSNEALTGILKAKELFSLLNKLAGDELDVMQTDKSWIIRSGSSKAELVLMGNSEGELTSGTGLSLAATIMERIKGLALDKPEWHLISESFREALEQCKFSSNRSPLSGIFVSDGKMVSTDEMRINFFDMGDDSGQFWITQEAANELYKMGNVVEYALNSTWVHFRSQDGSVFSCKRLQDEKFPFKKVLANFDAVRAEDADICGAMPAGLSAAVDRASVFYSEIDTYQTVRFSVKKEGIEIQSRRTSGNYEELIPWDGEMPENMPEIAFNVDVSMILYGFRRSVNFAVKGIQNSAGKKIYRLLFFGDRIRHLMSTLAVKETLPEENEETNA